MDRTWMRARSGLARSCRRVVGMHYAYPNDELSPKRLLLCIQHTTLLGKKRGLLLRVVRTTQEERWYGLYGSFVCRLRALQLY